MSNCKFYKKGDCVNRKGGMCQKHKSSNDGLVLNCIGSWSKDKIEHFRYYADIFSTAMKNYFPTRFYIDLFAGSGKCIIREGLKEINGTCLEVINLRNKFTKYVLVDNNSFCINSLKKRLSKYSYVKYYDDDCNSVVKEIIEGIPEYSLSLAVIDPYGLQFNFNSFRELSKKRIDLVVNYPISSVRRAISSVLSGKRDSKVLDSFHPGWRKIATKTEWGNSKEKVIRNLIDDYIKEMKILGYHMGHSRVPFKNIKNSTMYFLILFAKNKKGVELWEKAIKGMEKKNPQRHLI